MKKPQTIDAPVNASIGGGRGQKLKIKVAKEKASKKEILLSERLTSINAGE